MNETELQRLVVRLVGDMSSYVQMLKDAQKATTDSATEMKNQLAGLTKAAAGSLAALGAKEFLQTSVRSWDEQNMAIIKMDATLKANGRTVEGLSQDYQDFASEMQSLSTTADEVVLSITAQAESFQLTGEAAKKASHEAMALAEINDTSAQAMLRLTAAMAKGDVETAMMFSRLVPQLRGVKDEAEFTHRFQALVAAGMEVMEKKTQTASGALAQAANDWGDFKENIGELAEGPIVRVSHGLSDVSKWLQTLSPTTKGATVGLIGFGAGFVTIATVGPKVVEGIKAVSDASKALALSLATNPAILFTTAIAAAGIAIVSFKDDIVMSKDELVKFNKELNNVAQFWETETALLTSRAADRLSAIRGIENKEERKRAIEDQLGEVKKMIEVTEASIARGMEGRPTMIERWVGPGPEGKRHEESLKGLQKELRAAQDAFRNLEIEKERLNRPQNVNSPMLLILTSTVAAIQQNEPKIREGMDRLKKLFEEASSVRDKMRSPEEKMAEQQQRLTAMVMMGLISWKQYEKALATAKDELFKVEEATKKLSDTQRDAALGGTAEARSRIEAFFGASGFYSRIRQKMEEDTEVARGIARGGTGITPGWGRDRIGPQGRFMSVPPGDVRDDPINRGVGQGGGVAAKIDELIDVIKAAPLVRLGRANLGGG